MLMTILKTLDLRPGDVIFVQEWFYIVLSCKTISENFIDLKLLSMWFNHNL
jgi:hypothetical protein